MAPQIRVTRKINWFLAAAVSPLQMLAIAAFAA
jgi:hypothetical protein